MLTSLFKNRVALLLIFTLTSPLVLTGCRNRDADDYNRWEHETHREHVDQEKRSEAERKEYRDWRERQEHH